MNKEIVEQVLRDAREIYLEDKGLMKVHCQIVRVSVKDLEVLRIDTEVFPLISNLAKAIVTMEMVFEINGFIAKARECSALVEYLMSKGEK